MFGFGDAQEQYNQLNEGRHESKFSHELLAGGASFLAFKTFEDHQRKEGKNVSHQFAKELLAGFAGAEVDKLAETKGADFIDREKAKHQAKERAHELMTSTTADRVTMILAMERHSMCRIALGDTR